MKLHDQVNSFEQGKKLEELGINAKPLFCYCRVSTSVEDGYNDLLPTQWNLEGLPDLATTWQAPAFTVVELGVMLPHFDNLSQMGGFVHLTEFDPSIQDGKPWYCVWEYDKDEENAGFGREIIDGETEAQARAEMLIFCLERQLTTPEEVNQRLTS